MLKNYVEHLVSMVVLGVFLALQAACSPLALSVSKIPKTDSIKAADNVSNQAPEVRNLEVSSYAESSESAFNFFQRSSEAYYSLDQSEIDKLTSGDEIEFDLDPNLFENEYTVVFEMSLSSEEIKQTELNEEKLAELKMTTSKKAALKLVSPLAVKKTSAIINETHSIKIYAQKKRQL